MAEIRIRSTEEYKEAVQNLAQLFGFDDVSAFIEALIAAKATERGITLPRRANPRGISFNDSRMK